MSSRTSLTLADMVVLSMLAERAQHGYEMWCELERREVQEWASISKPQIYYSLKKLEEAGHIALAADDDPGRGPDRRLFRPTSSGRRALADALARAEWATLEIPSPFVTWMVLSWQARPRDFTAQVERRRRFLLEKLDFERAALAVDHRRDLGQLRRGDDRSSDHSQAGGRAGLARRGRGAPSARVIQSRSPRDTARTKPPRRSS